MSLMMKTNPIDFEYFDWLVSHIHIPNGKSYNELFEIMHNVEFHWTIPHDDDRMQDGLDLRYHFLDGSKQIINLQGATLLEILVSLSQKTAFTAGGEPKRWAWKLLKNLRLTQKSDPLRNGDLERINDVLDALIWRTYSPSGRGGFFPLKHPEEDQTQVDIWYQMNKYVMERQPL